MGMADFLNGGIMEAIVSLVCFTRWSVPMDFLAYINREPPNITAYPQKVQIQFNMYYNGYEQAHWKLPVMNQEWWTGLLMLFLMGFVYRIGGLLGLRYVNASKQV